MSRFRKIVIALLSLAAFSPVLANSALLAGDEAITNLRWKPGVIRIAISASLLRESPNMKADSDVTGAITRSLEAWSRIANVEFQQVDSEKLNASPSGAAGDGVNLITIAPTTENVLLFAKDPENAAATTRVFYNGRGVITEADVVLNPYQQFSTDGTLGTFDLESTITHEVGHLLGLNHSTVLGSTMHASNARNGVFGLQNFALRTLAADDITIARAIYGGREDAECCGSVEGRISFTGKQVRSVEVWIEDMSGRVNGTARSLPGEAFRFDGLSDGKYRVFAHETGRVKNAVSAQELGTVIVSSDETVQIPVRSVSVAARDFEVDFLGLNGQMSEMALPLSPGRSYVIYLGGRNLDPKKLSLSFTSSNLSVTPGTLRSIDYGPEISVVSFELRVAPGTPKGEYSIFAESDRGYKRAIIGGLSVDNFGISAARVATLDD